MEHLLQVSVAEAPPADAPQVQLMGRAGVETVDSVAAIGDARAHQEDVVGGFVGEPGEGRGDHGSGMAAQHVAVIDVTGVAGITGDICRRVPEPLVVFRQRDDAWAADVAPPLVRQRIDA
jgi:hypothetical protein